MSHRVVLASSNQGKLKELANLLKPLGIELIPQKTLGIRSVEETESTFLGNALLKARHASRHSALPAIGDDSGLAVDALQGEPGVFSARYAGLNATAEDNNKKLVENLKKVQSTFEVFLARFHCCLVLVRDEKDKDPLIAQACWEGTIVLEPQGSRGFGYDPHFFLGEENCTAAELSTQRKNELSHRGQAVRKLIFLLETTELFG